MCEGQLYSYPSLFNDRKLRLIEAKTQSTVVSGDRALESSDYLNVLLYRVELYEIVIFIGRIHKLPWLYLTQKHWSSK